MKILYLAFCLIITLHDKSYSQFHKALELWYDHPSGENWTNALPIGNGRLGAMVYGNVDTETVQLNEQTLWSGSPNRNDNPMALDSLNVIRMMIFNGRQKEAEQVANRTIISRKSQGQMFQPAGEIHLAFPDHHQYTHYNRSLDIERAVAKTSYTVKNIDYDREIIAYFNEPVIVIHLTASKPKSISFTAFFTTPQPNVLVNTTSFRQLSFSGTTIDHEGIQGKVKYKGIAQFKLNGGKYAATDTTVSVKDADEVTIFITVATNFKNYHDISGDENAKAQSNLSTVGYLSFAAILKAHIATYQKYFNRVKLNLGTSGLAHLPTDVRLKLFDSTNDPELVTLYYQFGRYLLISSSQPGGQPATLQGIWNNQLYPPWDSKYTININAEMNYWPAEKTNLSELHEPFLNMIKEMAASGRQTARSMYGARGWMAHHNTDIWRTTGAVDGAFWGTWNNGGGWTSQHLWEHYLYTGDKKYLASVYLILKEAALFYVDFLVEHPKYHWLVVCPDMSPENSPKASDGSSLDAGVTMTNQIVMDVFNNAIQSAHILNRDKDFADTLKYLRSRLAPMHIGQYGQLQEWLDDVDDPNDHHRHISHLYGLFPSNQISPYRTPQLYSAAKQTLLQRGDVSTGWSMGWKVNWWAKMLDGNHAYQLIRKQLTPVGAHDADGGTYNNLFDAHPPFQIDGNFGCTSGITEMLMQSEDGELNLLPAIPDIWQTGGSISGLCARGGFKILNVQWKNGRVIKAVIKSTLGGNLRLRAPNELRLTDGGVLKKATGENKNLFYQVEVTPVPVVSVKGAIVLPQLKTTYLYDTDTRPGRTYTFELKY